MPSISAPAERPASPVPAPVLEVGGLAIEVTTRRGRLRAVDGVSLAIGPGEIVGLVGESGAGKSLLASALIGLLPGAARIAAGSIRLGGRRIDHLAGEAMRRVRGKEIGSVFQDPQTSLDPVRTIGHQLVETIRTHLDLSAAAARKRAVGLLREVGVAMPEQRVDAYPHELSGGMRQRAVIALALCADPLLLVADEPTSALDVATQARLIELLKALCRQRGTAILLITHDLGVVADSASRVAIMYAGRIVESGPAGLLLEGAAHPYSAALIAAVPRIGPRASRLDAIAGSLPGLGAMPGGCAFHPRCPMATERCRQEAPSLAPQGDGHSVACWHVSAEVTSRD
jgi:peptide/nickel transport system ATP-binding protein